MKKNVFVLIDGNAILHRAYHAIPRFEVGGRLVNAVYGFVSILFSAIEKHHPEYLAVAFDVKGPTFRDDIFKEYKAKRVHPPQEFYDQIPQVWNFVRTMEIPLLTKDGYEADDIIGTLAKKVNGDLGEGEVIIVTGDQDTLQLVDHRTKVAMPAMGKIRETVYDAAGVVGKLGITPEQVIDYKALSGDSSDNIPGVRGIGPKTATELIKQFGSLENIYNNLDNKTTGAVKERTIKLLSENRDAAFMSKKLATIDTNVDFNFKLKDAVLHDFNENKVKELLEKFHFRSLVRRLPQSQRQDGQQEKLF